ncbi:DUF4255 domain-containing protein [Flavobacterium sp. SUN052]|uniref:DUF4255 domain-containing protein n=1 Tax=Flavobacterium sp. SUN052 TaxID=3002441 RepID=UPI00237EB0F3|nr:DUF4255 domain-containing protein [Flavobacterium sp. SUN052]MEC4004875.1 DUF4255 domain-containing protein [Flavobacterium sp. SUN052]
MTITEILQKLSVKIKEGSGIESIIANIATVHDDESNLDKSSVIFSIVNIEEDKTSKNQSLYNKEIITVPIEGVNVDAREKYKKPAQNLVLSILFTSYIKSIDQYLDGISKLEQIIRYLQNNNVFYFNSDELFEQTESHLDEIEDNKLIIDMITLKTDQLNQMWSYLGSKYMPSVLYTMRIIRIQNETVTAKPIIKEVKTQLWNNNKSDAAGELESGTYK